MVPAAPARASPVEAQLPTDTSERTRPVATDRLRDQLPTPHRPLSPLKIFDLTQSTSVLWLIVDT